MVTRLFNWGQTHTQHPESVRHDLEEVVRTIKTDLGRPLEDIFENFSQKPIASASVGQDCQGSHTLREIEPAYVDKEITWNTQVILELMWTTVATRPNLG